MTSRSKTSAPSTRAFGPITMRGGLLLAVHAEPAVVVRLLDVDAAAHVRADADGDVAVDGFDAAADVGVDQADRAVHGLDAAADVAAAVDEDAAVDGFDAAVDTAPASPTRMLPLTVLSDRRGCRRRR